MNLWVHGRENENSSGFLPYNFEHLPYHHMHTTLSTVQFAICRCPKPFGNVELSPDFIWFPGIRCACLFKEYCTILQTKVSLRTRKFNWCMWHQTSLKEIVMGGNKIKNLLLSSHLELVTFSFSRMTLSLCPLY
jgi:hypothetical protein